MKNRVSIIKKILIAAVVGLTALTAPLSSLSVKASNNIDISALENIVHTKPECLNAFATYYKEICEKYTLTDAMKNNLESKYNYIYNYLKKLSDDTSEDVLKAYLSYSKGELDKCIENIDTRIGDEYLMFSNLTSVQKVNAGANTTLLLSLINLGSTNVYDVVLTPNISVDDSWPFEVLTANEPVYVPCIFGATDLNDAMINKRADLAYNFKVKEDCKTGLYEIKFKVLYSNDQKSNSTELSTYVYVNGTDSDTESAPRIIVTGFTTEPEDVYAGDTFILHVTVKNTSDLLTVQNALFDLEATVSSGGSNNTESYAVFLPTSGSNSIFKDKIKPNDTFTIDIEMQAKADLAQKPYQLNINMSYDYIDSSKTLKADQKNSAEVSIPVKQEAKVETGTEEVLPNSIAVGEESNVMFDVFNTGKTTLYNVKVTFESDTISSGMAYLGNIVAGETKNVDTNVTGIAPDMGEGIVKAIISYEDENGNVSTIDKDISLSVYEEYYEDNFDDSFVDDGSYDDMNGGNSNKTVLLIVLPIIGVVIIVAIVVFIKLRKNKKIKEELKSLDEDDEL